MTSPLPRQAAHLVIRAYQLTLSALVGRHCRHLPSCSAYTDAAIQRHGLWVGGWMGLARISRCRPGGTSGFDPVPDVAPAGAVWSRPWRYGLWRGTHDADAPTLEKPPPRNRPPRNGLPG